MDKQELQKVYRDAVLKTNGGNDAYVVALLKISNAIGELNDSEECEIIETERNEYASDFTCSHCKKAFDLFRWVFAPKSSVNFCPNCGAKIKRGEK